MKKKIIRDVIAAVISIGLVLAIFSINKGFYLSGTELWRVLSDSFFVTGIIYLCIGLLFWVSNMGIFDMLFYGMMKFFDLFKKDVKNTRYASYLEYKEAKKESRIDWVYLAVIGIIYIAIASVFLYLYSK